MPDLHLQQGPVVSNREEEGPEGIALRAALCRIEDVARAVPRLVVEQEEAASLAVPQSHGWDEVRKPSSQPREDGFAGDAVEAIPLVVGRDGVARVAPEVFSQQLDSHLGPTGKPHSHLQRHVAGLGTLRRLLRRHAKAALLGGAEADLAHPFTNDAPSVSRAASQQVAHVGATVLHKHAVGEAADRGRDTDRPGADKVAVVVPLLDAEEVEVAPDPRRRLVSLAPVDRSHDVKQNLPRVGPSVEEELELLIADAVDGHSARFGHGMKHLPEGVAVLLARGGVASDCAARVPNRQHVVVRRLRRLRVELAEGVASKRLVARQAAARLRLVKSARLGHRVRSESRASLGQKNS